MNVRAYLDRISYQGSRKTTPETLRDLQAAHLLTVPFENLSIHAAEPIVLDDRNLFQKIVANKRGGFCYELNGLFAALLRELGFKVTVLAAEVASSQGGYGPNFDHMALLVNLKERWLVDVGFGDSFLEPLLLDKDGIQTQGNRDYEIVKSNDHFVLMQRLAGEDWAPQYRVTVEPHVYADFEEMCTHQQTSPESHFTHGRICSRATTDGRLTLSELRFIETSGLGAVRTERLLANEDEYADVLRERFGIVMTSRFIKKEILTSDA